jgi:hypothetical protein
LPVPADAFNVIGSAQLPDSLMNEIALVVPIMVGDEVVEQVVLLSVTRTA